MIELNKVELNHDDRCPCSSGEVYGACCGRFLGEFVRWYRLDILGASGGPFDASGTVEFVAYYRSGPGTPAEERVKGSMHELSRFEKVGGAWFYVDGDVR